MRVAPFVGTLDVTDEWLQAFVANSVRMMAATAVNLMNVLLVDCF